MQLAGDRIISQTPVNLSLLDFCQLARTMSWGELERQEGLLGLEWWKGSREERTFPGIRDGKEGRVLAFLATLVGT